MNSKMNIRYNLSYEAIKLIIARSANMFQLVEVNYSAKKDETKACCKKIFPSINFLYLNCTSVHAVKEVVKLNNLQQILAAFVLFLFFYL